MPDSRPIVVAVLSFRHSGSTVLGDVLGARSDAFYIGESHALWRRQLSGHTKCLCGAPMQTCESLSLGDLPPAEWRDWDALRVENDVLRSPLRFLRDAVRGRATRPGPATRAMAARQEELWRRERPGVRTVVDTSKHLRLLAQHAASGQVDLRVVHVVRDVRDVVNSGLRKGSTRKLRAAGPLRRGGAVLADATRWVAEGLYVERVLRASGVPFVRVRFEDWAADPERVTAEICAALGIDAPLVRDRAVEVGQRHVIWGNTKASGGRVTVRPPDRRRDALGRGTLACLGVLQRVVDHTPGKAG